MGTITTYPHETAGGDLPCIWVQAGVLSYRLCTRDYDCDNCELFHALRGQEDPAARAPLRLRQRGLEEESGGTSVDPVGPYLSRLIAGCQLHLDRCYSPGHFWLKPAPGVGLLAGLDSHIVRILYPIDEIVTPRPGTRLRRGEASGWILRGRLAVPLRMPVTGEIGAVNEAYVESARLHGTPEDEEDWLLRIHHEEAVDSIADLYRGERTLVWFLDKIRVLRHFIRDAVSAETEPELGVTMADGGAWDPNLEKALGRERFEALIDEIFGASL